MESKTLHFTVDPEGVVEFARERYWFQDAKKHGVNILKCFIGIEPYQVTKVLEGDATLREDPSRGNKIYYFEESDEDFKASLKDFSAYRKRMDEENFMYLGGIKVQKDLVDEYAGHVVKRLRETMRNTKNGIMFDPKDLDELMGLETKRQELHDALLEDAGFDRHDHSEEAREFTNALDAYVDKKAGTIMDEPDLEELTEEDIMRKRKESDGIMNYMERMNLSIAKQRGLI
jgi:hypothetical protein